MSYPIESKLVIAVSSTALFDLSSEDEIFRTQGLDAFINYQMQNKDNPPKKGAAFPFIKRILGLNRIFSDHRPVEVVILSRNHPNAGSRVMNSMSHYGLEISRASFVSGSLPYPYMEAFNAVLYLSTNKNEVKEAVEKGFPAGYVLTNQCSEIEGDDQLRIAFDFDGVIADDEAEAVYQSGGLPLFHKLEKEKELIAMAAGPLMPLFKGISAIQALEKTASLQKNDPVKSIKVAIITARNAPAHQRLVSTLNAYGVETDEIHYTGGIEKNNFLKVLKPQIFFDDQATHFSKASDQVPCVHIPFGVRNKPLIESVEQAEITQPVKKALKPRGQKPRIKRVEQSEIPLNS